MRSVDGKYKVINLIRVWDTGGPREFELRIYEAI